METSFETDASKFAVDELGNIYLMHDSFIERYNAVGNTKFRTSELSYGNIEYLDVTNPLKPFIHYRGLGLLVVFDNTLSTMGDPIDLFEKGFSQVELVAGSRGDAFWLWDSRNSEMIRVDQQFKKISSSGNLSVLLGKKINPVQILERGDHVYLRDPLFGLFVFDIYGSYQTTLKINSNWDIQVVNNEIVYSNDSTVFVIAENWISEEKLELPVHDSGMIYFLNRKLYVLSDQKLEVWKLPETTRN